MMKTLPKGSFFGQTVKRIQTEDFGLSETCYPAQTSLPLHTHELPYFGFVLDGDYTEQFDRRRRVCSRQSLIYHPAGERHEQHFETGAVRLFRIEIGSRYCLELNRFNLLFEYPATVRNREVPTIIRRLYREFEVEDDVSPLIKEGLILELIGNLARLSKPLERGGTGRPPGWLKQVCDLIEARFAEPLSLGALAREARVHPVTLAREFRRCYGCTIGDVVRRKRIEFARLEIVKGELPLVEIALRAGFYDQSHFTKIFKRLAGTTPREFQSRRRKS